MRKQLIVLCCVLVVAGSRPFLDSVPSGTSVDRKPCVLASTTKGTHMHLGSCNRTSLNTVCTFLRKFRVCEISTVFQADQQADERKRRRGTGTLGFFVVMLNI